VLALAVFPAVAQFLSTAPDFRPRTKELAASKGRKVAGQSALAAARETVEARIYYVRNPYCRR